MKLINADKLKNAKASDIPVYVYNLESYIKVEDLLNFINKQQPAYDIDKVVKELGIELKASGGYSVVRVSAFSRAIEIVKGGININGI